MRKSKEREDDHERELKAARQEAQKRGGERQKEANKRVRNIEQSSDIDAGWGEAYKKVRKTTAPKPKPRVRPINPRAAAQ